MVRFPLSVIACGSVDDGKSTLLGRLLHDAESIRDEERPLVDADAEDMGYAHLLDGLEAEREQGITIDLAHRHFASATRRYRLIDAPGHEQYTRNLVSGASLAEAGLLLIDATRGLLPQTRRHARILAWLAVPHLLVVINKMDRIDYSPAIFERLRAEALQFLEPLAFRSLHILPVSALRGDNVVARSARMSWYEAGTLLERLDALPSTEEIDRVDDESAFVMPVQWVNRIRQGQSGAGERQLCGRIVQGQLRCGDSLLAQPSGQRAQVRSILRSGEAVEHAQRGDSISLVLDRPVDIGRGQWLVAADSPLPESDQFEAALAWLVEEPFLPGREYLLKIGTTTCSALLQPLKYRLDPVTGRHEAAECLALNDLGVVELALDQSVAFRPFRESRELGGFILIDRYSKQTVAAGVLHHALRRASNVQAQSLLIDRQQRARQKQQRPLVIWFTGLSGAGKSTIANLLEQGLVAAGRHTYLLDGDNVRLGLNRDLGFTDQDRVENLRRVTEVARLMFDAGLIVLVAFISPFRAERDRARERIGREHFVEVFIDTSLEVAEARDVKGLYGKARRGELGNLTGIGSAYEPPEAPEIHIDTRTESAEQAAQRILRHVLASGR